MTSCQTKIFPLNPWRYSQRPRRVRQEVSNITQDHQVEEEDREDDEGVQDEREIWEVTHVSQQDLEMTEGEGLDLLAQLLELVGWSQINNNET